MLYISGFYLYDYKKFFEIFRQMDEATGFWVFRIVAVEVFSIKPETICRSCSPTTLQPAGKKIWITEDGIRARETKYEFFLLRKFGMIDDLNSGFVRNGG